MTENSPIFPVLHFKEVEERPLPLFHEVRVKQPEIPALPDLEAAVARAVDDSPEVGALPRGARVAVAVGSRGIACLPRIVRRVVDSLRDKGLAPFIVPAMGSHGGGTGEGQAAMLHGLGVDEESMGAPVLSSMETVNLGPVESNVDCHLDKNAAGADAIVIVARVKAHTSFESDIESGLCKMVCVGLGKAEGARNVHVYGRRGLLELMPRIAGISLSKAKFALGVAVVENADHEIAVVEGVAPGNFHDADRRLLARAKEFIPRLPFEQLDLLVVEKIGKDISGTGMDNKVVGRIGFRGDPQGKPFINSTVALGMTEVTHGNGIGVGNADIITLEMANHLDLNAMYYNGLTSSCIYRCTIPPVLPTDRAAVQAGLGICWQPDLSLVRACVIKSTAALGRMLVTGPLLEELEASGLCLEHGAPSPLEFTLGGRFISPL
ncbi:nickel pincer cofactor-dependent isomerase, group 22 [Desulfocurvus sp. DL9XJH121]